MKFPLYIAGKYFIQRKSNNAVNIITKISIVGILVGSAALLIVLSAFNGLEDLVRGYYNTFDPDLKISLVEGKYFNESKDHSVYLDQHPEISSYSKILEEKALLSFRDKEYVCVVKGVDNQYSEVTQIESALVSGSYDVNENKGSTVVLGAGVAYYLAYSNLDFDQGISVFLPKSGNYNSMNFQDAFSTNLIYPTGVFRVQPEFDEKYVIAPIKSIRSLLDRPKSLSSIEIDVIPSSNIEELQKSLAMKFGDSFRVENRDEQQAVFFKVMKSEALFSYIIFALILAIAAFTTMGSLSMMILEKKSNLTTFWSMGARLKTIRNIFFYQGLLISLSGALGGILFAIILVVVQRTFGLVTVGQGYVVDYYPVILEWKDVLLVFITVAVIGLTISYFTSRRINETFLKEN